MMHNIDSSSHGDVNNFPKKEPANENSSYNYRETKGVKEQNVRPYVRTDDYRQQGNTQSANFLEKKIGILVIVHDNGDGRALRTLLPDFDEKEINWGLIAFGPAEKLFEDQSDDERILLCSKTFPKEKCEEWNNNRTASLSDNDVDCFKNRFAPMLTLSGMAHRIQAQLLDNFRQKGSYTCAFYDNMELPTGQPWVQPWLDYKHNVNLMLVTTDQLTRHFSDNSKMTSLVKHPTLKDWEETFASEDRSALRQTLGLTDKPVALVAGGYGAAFDKSLEVIKSVAHERNDVQWLFTPHPKISKEPTFSVDDCLPLKAITDCETKRVATLANVIMTHKSTVGVFASQVGVPSIFVRPEVKKEDLKDVDSVKMVNDKKGLLGAIPSDLSLHPKQTTPAENEAKSLSLIEILAQELNKSKEISVDSTAISKGL